MTGFEGAPRAIAIGMRATLPTHKIEGRPRALPTRRQASSQGSRKMSSQHVKTATIGHHKHAVQLPPPCSYGSRHDSAIAIAMRKISVLREIRPQSATDTRAPRDTKISPCREIRPQSATQSPTTSDAEPPVLRTRMLGTRRNENAPHIAKSGHERPHIDPPTVAVNRPPQPFAAS